MVARGMELARHAINRRRTREGPEPACVQTPCPTQGIDDPAVVPSQSAWQKPPVRRKGGRTGLPARVSGRHVVRG